MGFGPISQPKSQSKVDVHSESFDAKSHCNVDVHSGALRPCMHDRCHTATAKPVREKLCASRAFAVKDIDRQLGKAIPSGTGR